MKEKKIRIKEPLKIKLLRLIVRPLSFLLWGYRVKNKYKVSKGENIIVLSNHQTDYDPILIRLSFNRFLYTLATDNIFSDKHTRRFLTNLGAIPKRKGVSDLKATAKMNNIASQGGSILIFPEGNRSYGEFQFTYTDGFAKFVRFFKKPIVLFNFHGGTGVDPRFAKSRRKGPFYGEIKRILQPEEFANWSDEELYRVIQENLRVYDSESGNLYKSDERAEYLERMFFVCPKCGKVETLYSKGNYFYCKNCGLKVEYTEDLHLKSDDPEFKFTKLVDWYNYQIRWIKAFEPKEDGEIFYDEEGAELYISHPDKKRELIAKGPVILTKNFIKFAGKSIDIHEIEIASPINGNNFNFSTKDEDYLVKGNDRFNPLKFVLMFNKLDTQMKAKNADVYYNLEERS